MPSCCLFLSAFLGTETWSWSNILLGGMFDSGKYEGRDKEERKERQSFVLQPAALGKEEF